MLLGALTTYQFISRIVSKDKMAMWSPLTFASLIFIYYTVSGPLISISTNATYFKLLEHRPFFESGWMASLLAFISLLLGYNATNKPLFQSNKLVGIQQINNLNYGAIGLKLYALGFLLFLVYAGGSITAYINPFSSLGYDDTGYIGSFRNYFILPINFFVPALCLMLVGVIDGKFSKVYFLGLLLMATGIYLSFAFRYRIVILGMGLATTFYLYKGIKPRLLLALLVFVAGVTAMGIIESTRTYFGGLNLDRIEDKSYSEMFLKGFGESRTFGTLGLMIKNIPEQVDYIYFAPYVQGFLMPIPRSLWPGKPAGEHLSLVTDLYPNGQGTGAAWPFYGEYYFSFGWLGIVVGSFLLGFILKRFYRWMVVYQSPLVIITYATGLGCLFFVMTRGYFPQHVMLFFFSVYPCFFIMKRIKNSYSGYIQIIQ